MKHMNRTFKRALTTTTATVGIVALFTGTASAHFCYRKEAPGNARMVNGAVWITAEEKVEEIFTYNYVEEMAGPACEAAVVEHIETHLAHALFMGPGLPAGGAAFKGKAPDQFGYLLLDLGTLDACAPPTAG